jgi:hypothetical protein
MGMPYWLDCRQQRQQWQQRSAAAAASTPCQAMKVVQAITICIHSVNANPSFSNLCVEKRECHQHYY